MKPALPLALLFLLAPCPAFAIDSIPENKTVRFEAEVGILDLKLEADNLVFHFASKLPESKRCGLEGKALKSGTLEYSWSRPAPNKDEDSCELRIKIGAGVVRASYSVGCYKQVCERDGSLADEFHMKPASCSVRQIAKRRAAAAKALATKNFDQAFDQYESLHEDCRFFLPPLEGVRLFVDQARAKLGGGDRAACQKLLERVEHWLPDSGPTTPAEKSFHKAFVQTLAKCKDSSQALK